MMSLAPASDGRQNEVVAVGVLPGSATNVQPGRIQRESMRRR